MAKRGRKRGRKPKKITELKSELKAVRKALEQSISHSRKMQTINTEYKNAINQLNELIMLLNFTTRCSDATIRRTASRLVNKDIQSILNSLSKENNEQKSE